MFDEIVKMYNEEIERLKSTMGSGQLEDFHHYKQLVGSIQGIEWCLHALKDVVNKINKEEE